MKIDMTDLLNSITENLKRIDYIKPEEIPNIDLYMDQVTTFMEEQLVSSKRYADDKILSHGFKIFLRDRCEQSLDIIDGKNIFEIVNKNQHSGKCIQD